MAFREVTVIETKEVLRLWRSGVAKKRIAAQLGVDVKTVRGYVKVAEELELDPALDLDTATAAVVDRLAAANRRPRGPTWDVCAAHADFIRAKLEDGVRLTKIRKLLQRQRQAQVSYLTLHRFAVEELGFGRRRGDDPRGRLRPGRGSAARHRLGGLARPDMSGKRGRRFRAWIFTSVRSRTASSTRCSAETTETAIEACEAAWEFFGGVFKVLIPDNTKTIVHERGPAGAAAGRRLPGVRPGARLPGRPDARAHARRTRRASSAPCQTVARRLLRRRDADERRAGARARTALVPARSTACAGTARPSACRASTSRPRSEPALLPAPTAALRHAALVRRPRSAATSTRQVAEGALLAATPVSRPKHLRARADRSTVRFYDGQTLVKTHPRMAARAALHRSRATSRPRRRPTPMRDVAFLTARPRARRGGGPLRHRRCSPARCPGRACAASTRCWVLARRYGSARVDEACAIALDADMLDVQRLRRMLEIAAQPPVDAISRRASSRSPATCAPQTSTPSRSLREHRDKETST